jgi:acetyltransferase-like isoleucine patch superfamily enzyme
MSEIAEHKVEMRSELEHRGPLQAYQDLAVGTRSMTDLVLYEVLVAWGAAVPGAAGFLLRGKTWPRMLHRAGRGIVWGRNVVLRHPGKMWIEDRVLIDDACYFDAKGCGQGDFHIETDVLISRSCIVSGKDGPLRIGARANIGAGCILYASTGLEIGADTMLAAQCYIGGGRYDVAGPIDVPISQQSLPRRGVIIEDDCWLGAGVVVVDGVRIGRGSIVGAGAVVTKDLPPYSIAAGVPARVLHSRTSTPSSGEAIDHASATGAVEVHHPSGIITP